ncbi:trans-sialidase [Trypanosoma cruzi Dm28c]|uniref:Trans-sialidase n=1 Tax=Trypanosoma cruzi Dm28c TaxID=1416333 RepID=V5CZR3_TRYCR|nr:trans-sialidase [Trypanosoma cruzi Dm28c]
MQARWCSLLHDTHRCRPAWLHGRGTVTVFFVFHCIEWTTSLSLSPTVCVFCFTGAMRVCVRWSSHASAFFFYLCCG